MDYRRNDCAKERNWRVLVIPAAGAISGFFQHDPIFVASFDRPNDISIMAGLVARDAAIQPGAVAAESTRTDDIPRLPKGNVCAVFRNAGSPNRNGFVGVVSSAEIFDHPGKPVGSLIQHASPQVADSQAIVEVLKLLRGDGADHLAVFDGQGKFVGVIGQRSIMEALIRRERELLRKTREFRQTSQDDKERRYETTRRLEQTNLAFRKLLTALARPENLESFKQALEALTVVADAGWAQIALCDENGRIFQRALASHPSADSFPPNYQAENMMMQVIAENGIINRAGSPGQHGEESSAEGTSQRQRSAAFLGIPLAMDDRRFGCVYLWDKLGGRAFVDDDEILLSSLAHAVSITLSHAIDLSRRKRLEYELDLLGVIAREVGGAGTVECVAEIVRKHTETYWNWDAFSIGISKAHSKKFQAILQIDRSTCEAPPEPEPVYQPFQDTPSEGLLSSDRTQIVRRILSGEPVLINRQNLDDVVLMQPFGDVTRPSASMIYVPIHGNKRVIGSISVHSYQKNRFTMSDMAILQRMASAVAPAFRRCLAEATTRAFFDLTRRLSSASTPQQAARIIVDVADDLIGWDACSLHFYNAEDGTHSQVLLIDTIDDERREFHSEAGTHHPGGLSLRTIREGPILYLRPEARFDSAQCHPFGDMGKPSASLLYVPLKFNERILGVLSVQSYTINAYDQDDLDLLTALADQCSGTIERIRKG